MRRAEQLRTLPACAVVCPSRISPPTASTHQMSPKLQEAMEGLISVFHSYSANEGDKYKLSKAELKTLLQGELACLLASSKDPMVVDKIMKDLDENQDGQVDFQEFVVLVAALTVACNEFFVDLDKNKAHS